MPVRLAVYLGAACAAWLAVIVAMWNAGMPQSAAGLPRVIPDDPKIAMADALSRFDTADKPPEEAVLGVQKAARLSVLEDEPRLLLARLRMAEGKGEEAIRLLEDARRLNPRSRETRLLLLQQYLLLNRSAGVIQETSALNSLMPRGRNWFIGLLANLARTPDTQHGTLAALPRHPLQIPVLEKLSADGASAPVLLQASPNLRGTAKPGAANPWVMRIVMPLVQRGDISGARRLWAHFHAVKDPGRAAAPFDGELTGLAGSPFGWRAVSGPAGVAEIANGALNLEYFGRKPAMLANQLISLAPGNYRLRFDAAQTDSEKQDGLFWTVACLDGPEIFRSPLHLSSDMAGYTSAVFSIPGSGCAAQWLKLEGEPELDAKAVSATIDSIKIERM